MDPNATATAENTEVETTVMNDENTATAVLDEVNTEEKVKAEKKPAKKPVAKKEKPAKAPKVAKPKAEKKPAKKEKLTDDELRAEEKALKEKYSQEPHNQRIVKDSIADIGAAKDLRGEAVDAKFRKWNKRTVEIVCQWKGCKETRRIATSDLAQVKFCETHTIESRKERRKAIRAANKAAKPAKVAKTKAK